MKGWYKESARHSLAAKGVPTGKKLKINTNIKTKPYNTVDISMLKKKNVDTGQYWFEPDTLKFFKSRYGEKAYIKKSDPNTAYFISSEQAPYNDRKWTIRKMDMTTGDIGSYDEDQRFEFQQFGSYGDAKSTLMLILEE